MNYNEISFIMRFLATAMLLIAAILISDVTLSHLFTGLSIFMGISALKQHFSNQIKD